MNKILILELLCLAALSNVQAAGSTGKRMSDREAQGTIVGGVVGAGAGAGIGAAAAGAGSRGVGAAVGGPIGLVAGLVIGNALSRDSKEKVDKKREESQSCKCSDGCCQGRNLRSAAGKHCSGCKQLAK